MFIPIFSYTRSGSSWLGDIITNRQMYGINNSHINDVVYLHEYFTNDIGNVRMKNLGHLSVDSNTKTVNGFNEMYKYFTNKNLHFVIKIFDGHLPDYRRPNQNILSVVDILNYSDFAIHNYRNNILKSWISRQRVAEVNQWQGNADHNNINTKVTWMKTNFVSYAKYRISVFQKWKMLFDNHSLVNIEYEELHAQKNKKHFLRLKFHDIGCQMSIHDTSIHKFSKECLDISSNFINQKQFLRDYEEIKQYIFLINNK